MIQSIARAYREAYGGLSREVWVLSLALFINRCGAMVLAFLTLYLTKELQFTMDQAGLIFGFWGFGSLTGAYLGGRLTKRLGAIRIQIIGLLLAVPCFMIVPLFTTFWPVAISVFFFSVTSESVRPANFVAVSQFTKPELTTRAFGLQRMAVNLGYSIGPAVGGFLALVNYHWLFYVDGVTTGLGAVLLWFCFGFRKYAKNEAAAEMQKAAEEKEQGGSPSRDLVFVIFLVLIGVVALVFFQFHATYPKYLAEHYQLGEERIGILFSINTAIIVALEMLLLEWIRDFSLLRTIGWGSLLACVGFGLLPLGQTFWFAALSMSVITFGEMLMFPIGSSFVAHRSAHRDQSAYMSWYAMMYALAGILAPILGTKIYVYDPHLIWKLSVGIGVLAVAGFYFLEVKSRTTRHPDEPLSASTEHLVEDVREPVVAGDLE